MPSELWNSVPLHSNIGLVPCTSSDPRECHCFGACLCHKGDVRVPEARERARKVFAERHAADVHEGFKNPCAPGTCEHGTCEDN